MVKWIRDYQAEKILNDLGIKYEIKTIAIATINKTESLQNKARLDLSLDQNNVDSIARGAALGDPVPALVIRRKSNKMKIDYTVAGGNHRLEAVIRLGEEVVECYQVEVGENEFSVLCQKLNLANGKGVTVADRVRYAVDAIDKGICSTQKEASEMFRVDANAISHKLAERRVYLKLSSRTDSSYKPPLKVAKALANIQSKDVHDKAFEFVESSKKLNREDVVEVINTAMAKETIAEQIAVFEQAKALTPERKIATADKQAFLKSLRKIESILDKHKTLESLDIVTQAHVVKQQIDSICKRLNQL